MTRNIPPIAIITGTGMSEQFDLTRPSTVRTPFGKTTAYYQDGEYVVVPRHGAGHGLPPHAINYRANIAALEKLRVKKVIATSAVGSMDRGFRVGEIGLIEQFLDFTKRRQMTFFENRVVHTDVTNPYSSRLNLELLASAKQMGLDVRTHLVYVCVEGPRFETAAEIKMYKILGGDVVGMTGVPEVVLANEKKLEYASVAIATNWAAGMQPRVSQEEVLHVMRRSGKVVKQLIETTVESLTGEQN
jgi:5'-methylthioadenosine phosphorylase